MELILLKEEYKKELRYQNGLGKIATADLDQQSEEIDEANTLQEFVDVVNFWSQDAIRIGAAMVILKRVINLHEQ